MSPRRRDSIILLAAGALALLVPVAASHYLQLRINSGLEPALERRLGVDVDIGGIDASLTGVVRLSDVKVADMFAATSVEAAIGLGPLVSGELFLDEVRVDQPHLRIVRTANRSTNLQDLVARLRKSRRGAKRTHTTKRRRSRIGRVVVTGGELVVDFGKRGQVRARDVELHAKQGGVRVISGPVSMRARRGAAMVHAAFKRAAGDIDTSNLGARRLLAVAGNVKLTAPNGHVVNLDQAALSRGVLGDPTALTLRGSVAHVGGSSQVDVSTSLGGALRVHVRGKRLPIGALTGLRRRGVDLSRAFADGTITLDLASPTRTTITGAAAISGVRVSHELIASVPVDFSGRVQVNASLLDQPGGRRLVLSPLTLARNGAELQLKGSVDWRGGRLPAAATITAELPTVACQKALTALPMAMRDRLSGMNTRGKLGARVALTFDRATSATSLDVDVNTDQCQVLREPLYANAKRLKRHYRHTFPDGRKLRLRRGSKGFTSLGSLPRHVVRAFISGEDARFYDHNGFDPRQIERSLAIDLRDARFVRGGSTISQQLVKNLFLTHRRTLARKFQEAVLTWRLEKHLSKRLILERYLNIIELGEGVYGIQAAARHWFDKPASKLRLREAAFLAALTPAPTTISRRIRNAGGMDKATRDRVRVILRAMRRDRAISRADYDEAKHQRLKLRVPKVARRR